MRNRTVLGRLAAATLSLLTTVGAISLSNPARAATVRRFSTDDRGNFVIFGNTVGFDCRDQITDKPVVGTVPVGLLGLFSCNGLLPDSDTGVDILWRSDSPQNNQAAASQAFGPSSARSTAVLALPAGAAVVHARLYWAAQRTAGQGAGQKITVERPGLPASTFNADAANGATRTLTQNGLDYYQSSADITSLVQALGAGAYRVSGIDTIDIRTQNRDVSFVTWNVVVVYRLASDPIRSVSVFDGLERVSTSAGSKTSVSLKGFTVPVTGFSAQLGVIAYEGDSDITGDQLIVNGSPLSNSLNPVNNFFNRTSSILGVAAPKTGDLPQLTGKAGSMSGFDVDVVDISDKVAPGATAIDINATTSGDEYFLGAFATAFTTIRPVFGETQKIVRNLTRQDGRYLPGDQLEYLISTRNTGNDTGRAVIVNDVLPMGVTYLPGSLQVVSGPNMGNKTDAAGDDQAEYVAATRTIVGRLGTGANSTNGGDLKELESTSLRFVVTINAGATGTITNQAVLSAIGATAQAQGVVDPSTWNSGNGTQPGAGTTVTISTCTQNADCPISAPICDTAATPPLCVCRTSADCSGGRVCSPISRQCVDCIPGVGGICDVNTTGICLLGNVCGCTTNADCGGRTCDTVTKTCPLLGTDLGLTLTRTPSGSVVLPSTLLTYQLTAANSGPTAVRGASIAALLSPGVTGVRWTCTGQSGAQCPAATGTGVLATLADLPVGGSLRYTFTGTAPSDAMSQSIDFTASIQPPPGFADPNPTNNTVIDSTVTGQLASGPDLSVMVFEEYSATESGVTYRIEVQNKGPGPAEDVVLSYKIPADTLVTVTAGQGWTCTQDTQQVTCHRSAPLAEGNADPVRIRAVPTQRQTMLPVLVQVDAQNGQGQPLQDPNPADNKVERTSEVPLLQFAGGGFGCDCNAAGGEPRAPLASMLSLLGLLAVLGMATRSRRVIS